MSAEKRGTEPLGGVEPSTPEGLLARQKRLYESLAELIDRQEKALQAPDMAALLAVLADKQHLFLEMQQNEQALRQSIATASDQQSLKAALEGMAVQLSGLLEREEKSLGALRALKDEAVRTASDLQRSKRLLDAYRSGTLPDTRFIDEDT